MKPPKVAARKGGSLQRRVWNRSKNNLSNTIGENYMEQITMYHTDPLKGAASKAARRKGVRACTRQMTPIQCCLHSLGQFCKCNFEQQVYMYKSMTEWPLKKCAWVLWMLLENMYKIRSSLMQNRNDIIWCLNSQAGCLTNNQQCPLFPSAQFFCWNFFNHGALRSKSVWQIWSTAFYSELTLRLHFYARAAADMHFYITTRPLGLPASLGVVSFPSTLALESEFQEQVGWGNWLG